MRVELLSCIHHDPGAATGLRKDMFTSQKERLCDQEDFDCERYPNITNMYELRK